MDKERVKVNNCHVKQTYKSYDINSCQKNRDVENLRFLMKILYTVTHIMQKYKAELVLLLVLSRFGSVDLSAAGNCPLGQVPHFNLTIHKEFCCVPVSLPKGYGYKSCAENGKNDTIEVCLTEPVRLYQWDDTTTASEATCTAEMQCLSEDNMKIEICEESGQNCHNECVCNFRGGYCGTEYFNCNPFPVDCPRGDVQKDCSCRRSIPLLGSESTSSKPIYDVKNSMNPDTSASKLPSASDKKIEGDQTADGGVMKEEENKSNQNSNATILKTEGEESLSSLSGSHIAIIIVACVLTVVGTVVVILVCVFRKDLCKKLLRRSNKRLAIHDAERQKPVGKVKPFHPLQDHNEEAHSLQRHVIGQGEPAVHEVETLPFLSGELQMNMSLNCPPMGNSLFHSHVDGVDQQDVSSDDLERHQTDAKVVVISENLSGNDGHHRG